MRTRAMVAAMVVLAAGITACGPRAPASAPASNALVRLGDPGVEWTYGIWRLRFHTDSSFDYLCGEADEVAFGVALNANGWFLLERAGRTVKVEPWGETSESGAARYMCRDTTPKPRQAVSVPSAFVSRTTDHGQGRVSAGPDGLRIDLPGVDVDAPVALILRPDTQELIFESTRGVKHFTP